MNRKLKQLLSLLLCLLLLSQSSFAVDKKKKSSDEQNKLKKEEVIYSKLNYSGSNELLIAVNGFPKGFKGKDYGDYSEVTNLSTTEELSYKQNQVEIKAKENFYYQGKLKTKELPWIISIKWKLDGKEVTDEELLGKSGLLNIDYEIKKNPKIKQDYFERYVLQTSFNFKVDQVGKITAPDGTLAVAGSSKMVNFMTLPGKGGKYQIEAEVTNFEPGMVQIAALPLNFALDASQFGQYTDDLKTLEMAIAQISGGTGSLVSGIGEISDGAGKLGSGGEELLSGSQRLSGGLNELQEGSGSLQDGLGQYAKGMNQFSEGILMLTQGMGELGDALPLLSSGSEELRKGFALYLQGVKELSSGIHQTYEGTAKLEDGVVKLGDGLWQLVVAGKGDGQGGTGEPNNLVDASAQFLKAFEILKIFENFELTEEQAEVILHTLEFIRDTLIPTITQIDQNKLLEIVAALENAHSDITTVIGNLTTTRDQLLSPEDYAPAEGEDAELVGKVSSHYKEQMTARANEITNQIAKLEQINTSLQLQKEAAALFHEYFGTLETSFNQFKAFLEDIQKILVAMDLDKEKILSLNDQLKKLTRGYEQFHAGLVQYVDGVEQIYEAVAGKGVDGNPTLLQGVKELRDGLRQLDEGGATLASKGDELYDGVDQLSKGVQKLVEGLSQFGDKKDELEGGVKQLQEGANQLYENYQRFHSGLSELNSGMGSFHWGLGQYVHGFWQLSDGLRMLYDGAKELNSGTSQLADETKNMDQKMLDKIKEAMAEFSSEDYEPESFLDKRNKDIKSVQFVLLYEGKTKPVQENPEEEAPPSTFWEKLLNIFK